MLRKTYATTPRRGMILLVVLAVLTLFAIVGISFVLYSNSALDSSKIAKEVETQLRADFDPELALAYFLNQLIYDTPDDTAGVQSALRGHSLARSMYGYNAQTPNQVPFIGTGRLQGQADSMLVNYLYHLTDGFVRDPERYGTRANPQAPYLPNSWIGGFNVPYTYPDQNNMYLGAMRASDGAVLAHSFHRLYTGIRNASGTLIPFGSLSPTNPNWTNNPVLTAAENALMKYAVLRPRPADHINPLTGQSNFPLPEDAGGDVKNLLGSRGYFDPITNQYYNNDSIWMDLGSPVMTAPDGRKFKMLFAPLILDLDGLVNVNVHGNILGAGRTHMSNQGLGPWAVNLSAVLNAAAAGAPEWPNLFQGNARFLGRYGPTIAPDNGSPTALNAIVAGRQVHFYAQVDPDECAGRNGLVSGGSLTGRFLLPTERPPDLLPFPTYGVGFGNGGAVPPLPANPNYNEYQNHPRWHNVIKPTGPSTAGPLAGHFDRRFPVTDLERLRRHGDTGTTALVSELELLCPLNFNDNSSAANAADSARRRRLVTTDSYDREVAGLAPWVWDPTLVAYGYVTPGSNYADAPHGIPLPPGTPAFPAPAGNPPAVPANSEYQPLWRLTQAANLFRRIELNRRLEPYPGDLSPVARFDGPGTYTDPFTNQTRTFAQQYLLAQTDRQKMAFEIYSRLLAVTGTPHLIPVPNTDPQFPGQLATRRWLAQLAVNIVDYIDEDNISTPFYFYRDQNGNNFTGVSAGELVTVPMGELPPSEELPRYWVFGTELPKVVINEAMVQSKEVKPLPGAAPQAKVWVELMNTMSDQIPATAPTTQQQDAAALPLAMEAAGMLPAYSVYHIVLAPGLWSRLPQDLNENVLGTPNIQTRGGTRKPPSMMGAVVEFSQQQASTIGGVPQVYPLPRVDSQNYPGTSVSPATSGKGFFLVGPSGALGAEYINPFNAGPIHNTTPVFLSEGMTYDYAAAPVPPIPADAVTNGLTVVLRRLANPHLPHNPTPGDAMGNPNPLYNPYITVDYLEKVLFNEQIPPATYYARGKKQPYTARTRLLNPPGNDADQLDPTTLVENQTLQDTVETRAFHTFGRHNTPRPFNPPNPLTQTFDWLVHLDRALISPMELLQVSGYQPYQLTQQFMLADVAPAARNTALSAAQVFQHRAPWFDQSRRLYRAFELFKTGDQANGNNNLFQLVPGASPLAVGQERVAGKINLNGMWDMQTFQAMLDANTNNSFLYNRNVNGIDTTTPPDPNSIPNLFTAMLLSRSLGSDQAGNPIFIPGPTDLDGATIAAINNALTNSTTRPFVLNRPFHGLGTGPVSPGGLAPAGRGIPDTLLRSIDTLNQDFTTPGAGALVRRLFQHPGDGVSGGTQTAAVVHPYQQYELLTKLYNRVTTRSNVFAVWVTVGFFEVEDETTTPVRLGREIGRAEGRHVRHRMFAVIDRSDMQVFAVPATTPITIPPAGFVDVPINTLLPPSGSGVNPNNGRPWQVQVGMLLVLEPDTPNEELVQVQTGAGGLFVRCTKPHTPSPAYMVVARGNPGASTTRYDLRKDKNVVLHFSLID